jgi:hypothetical protein
MHKPRLWHFAGAIVLSVATSGLLTTWLLAQTIYPLLDQLALYSPIAVVDFGQAVLSLGPDATEQDIEKRLLTTNEQIARLKEAGFIVLDAQAVVGADAALYLPLGDKEANDGLRL